MWWWLAASDSADTQTRTVARSLKSGARPAAEIVTLKALTLEYDAEVAVHLGAIDADPIQLAPISAGQTGVAHLELSVTGGIWLQNESATASVSITLVGIGNTT